MQLENAQKIVNALLNTGTDAELYEDYSGRGMFGAFTAGVVVKNAGSVEVIMHLLDIHDSCRTDSMGLDVIVY